MTIWNQVVGFPALTISAAIQALIVVKIFPAYYGSHNHLIPWVAIFLLNYSFGAIFWLVLYPRLFSPFRHIDGPRVSSIGIEQDGQG